MGDGADVKIKIAADDAASAVFAKVRQNFDKSFEGMTEKVSDNLKSISDMLGKLDKSGGGGFKSLADSTGSATSKLREYRLEAETTFNALKKYLPSGARAFGRSALSIAGKFAVPLAIAEGVGRLGAAGINAWSDSVYGDEFSVGAAETAWGKSRDIETAAADKARQETLARDAKIKAGWEAWRRKQNNPLAAMNDEAFAALTGAQDKILREAQAKADLAGMTPRQQAEHAMRMEGGTDSQIRKAGELADLEAKRTKEMERQAEIKKRQVDLDQELQDKAKSIMEASRTDSQRKWNQQLEAVKARMLGMITAEQYQAALDQAEIDFLPAKKEKKKQEFGDIGRGAPLVESRLLRGGSASGKAPSNAELQQAQLDAIKEANRQAAQERAELARNMKFLADTFGELTK